MTTGNAIIEWLYDFGDIEINPSAVIETDQLGSGADSYGLYKQANRTVVPFVDGTRDVAEYYYLLVRQASKADASRIENQAWLEALEAWVRARNMARNLPQLDPPRSCYSIDVNIGGYMMDMETDTAAYQLGFEIKYMEGKNTQ